jgi:hypothetical protein
MRLGFGAHFISRARNELKKPQTFGIARIPVGVSRAGRDEQAIACLQRERGFTVLLPNACARDDIECYRRRMVVTRIDCSWRVLRIPNNDFLPGISRNVALEQASVGDTDLAVGSIGK